MDGITLTRYSRRAASAYCAAKYKGSALKEKLVVTYGDALFATCSLLVGPEFRLLPYDNNKKVHISDWWAEWMEEMKLNSNE